MHRIVTQFIYPPIPLRQFDWQATFDGYEPGDPIGHGRTERDAVRDLKEQWEEACFLDEKALKMAQEGR